MSMRETGVVDRAAATGQPTTPPPERPSDFLDTWSATSAISPRRSPSSPRSSSVRSVPFPTYPKRSQKGKATSGKRRCASASACSGETNPTSVTNSQLGDNKWTAQEYRRSTRHGFTQSPHIQHACYVQILKSCFSPRRHWGAGIRRVGRGGRRWSRRRRRCRGVPGR